MVTGAAPAARARDGVIEGLDLLVNSRIRQLPRALVHGVWRVVGHGAQDRWGSSRVEVCEVTPGI